MPQGLMLTDLAIAGALLIIAKLLRVHLTFLQRMYMPSAVLAGLLGLAFGPAGMNVLPWTETFTANAGLLTAALFSSLGLATDLPSPKIVAQRAGSLWAFNQVASVSQWLFAAMLGLLLTTFFWTDINPAFGVTMSAGFMGGHGSATVVGDIFSSLGWEDGFTLGLTFVTGFLIGMLVRIIAKQTQASKYLCDGAFKHAAGISTDYLIIFGISAIKITVLAQYLAPMVLMATAGIMFTLWLILWVAPRILGDDWFEKGIFSWGWLTGTVAMGIALLRIVDPKMRSNVLDDYAIAYVPGSITDIFIISLMPVAMYSGYHWHALVVGLAYIAIVLGVWRFVLNRQGTTAEA